MISALPIMLGVQLCLAFIAFDVASEPSNSQRHLDDVV